MVYVSNILSFGVYLKVHSKPWQISQDSALSWYGTFCTACRILNAGLPWVSIFTLKKDPSELSQLPAQHSHCPSSQNQSLSHCKPTPKEAVGKSQSVIVSAVPVIVSLITCQYRQQIDGCPTIHPPAFRPGPSAINRINLVGIITFIITITVWFVILKLDRQHNETIQSLPKTPYKLRNKQGIRFY